MKLVESITRPYIVKLADCAKDRDGYQRLYELAKKELQDLKKEKVAPKENDAPQSPRWLDTNLNPYSGKMKTENGYEDISDVRNVFSIPFIKIPIYQEATKDRNAEEKLRQIWRVVANCMVYKYDVNEDWQSPGETLLKGTGDCEDSSLLFVSMAHACGISDAWVATGELTQNGQRFGHAYVMAKHSDGKYYIYETTLHGWNEGYQPLGFEGQDQYTDDWGYANGYFKGKRVRGPMTSSQALFEDLDEERNEMKMKAIAQIWGK